MQLRKKEQALLRIKKEPDIPVQQKQQHFKAEKRKKRTMTNLSYDAIASLLLFIAHSSFRTVKAKQT